MPTGRKLAVVLSVLVAGWSAALFFRKDASTSTSANTASASGHRDVRDVNEPLTRRAVTLPGQQSVAAFKTPIVATQFAPESADAPQLKTYSEAVSSPPTAVTRRFTLDDVPVAEDSPNDERVGGADWPDQPAVRTHKIVDGDTLSRLAQRYLGSADRYQQIYEANRDVLRSPDLLPIGKVLRLPDRADRGNRSRPGQTDGAALDQRSANLEGERMPKMVPITHGPLRIRSD